MHRHVARFGQHRFLCAAQTGLDQRGTTSRKRRNLDSARQLFPGSDRPFGDGKGNHLDCRNDFVRPHHFVRRKRGDGDALVDRV